MNIQMRHFTAFAISVAMSGCASAPSARASAVHDADTAMVAGCRFVGVVHGTSGFGGVVAETGITNAQNQARDSAAALGATHIVWDNITGGMAPNVSGKAYNCR